MRFPNPGGFGGLGLLGGVFTDILAGLVFIICFVIVVGVLFVLVRFLWVATRAAEIYIAKNSADRATTTTAPSSRAATAPAAATTPAATRPAATRPAATSPTATKPTPRTPKTDSK
jgi:hypothetical protein